MVDGSNKLGKYTLVELLGSGTYGTVYKANDNGRTVALKILKPAWVDDLHALERFRREAHVSLYHKQIATVIDADEDKGRFFLVMRYVDGVSLEQVIKQKGRLGWQEGIQILAQVADGLDYAHQKNIIHRDIKPANILISEKEGAVLTDFGLLRAAEAGGMSTSGGVQGTPPYIAPEIWEGKPAGPGADLYSLACVACEIFTGEVLFNGTNTPSVMGKHMQENPPLPDHWPPGIPPSITPVLMRAFNKEPARRYDNASQFVGALMKKGDAYLQHEQELAQQEAAGKAQVLLAEAEFFLKHGQFAQVEEKLKQAAALTPNAPEVEALREQTEQAMRLARAYTDTADLYQSALDKARTLLAVDPHYPDPREIFTTLGLRQLPTLPAARVNTAHPFDRPELAGLDKLIPLALVLVGLPFLLVGIGLLSITAGIGLLWRKNWARNCAIVFACLLEAAGVLAMLVDPFYYQLSGIPAFAGLLVFLGALFMLFFLAGPGLAKYVGAADSRPAGIWMIFTAWLCTGAGIPAAVLLIKRQPPYSFLLARGYTLFLAFVMLLMEILGVMMDRPWALAAYPVMFVLCVVAFFYLGKPATRHYLANH